MIKREIKTLPIVFLIVSSLLLFPIFVYPTDWAGWIFIYISFTLPFLFARVRRDRKLLTIFLVLIAIHNGVSVYNVYFSTVFGADLDAATFQARATDLATSRHPVWFTEFSTVEIGSNVYTSFLAGFYRVFGVSLLLGQVLSVIAYTLSSVILIYSVSSLRLKYRRTIFVIYGLSAPAIIYCSVTMREAWQALLFLLILYLALRLRENPSIFKATCIPFVGLTLGMLHNGLFVYSLALVAWSLYWGASGRWKKAGHKKLLIRVSILVTAITISGVWIYLGGEIGGISSAIRSGEVATYTETYREKGDQEAAANYQVKVDTSSLLTFIKTGSLAFIYYQFAPFPWEVRRFIDVYAASESMLRLTLIFYMFRLWWMSNGRPRQKYTYLIICYLSLEFLWSLGTANWGTALRHHIIAYGVLALLGTPGLMYSLERLFFRLRLRTSRALYIKRYEMRGVKIIS